MEARARLVRAERHRHVHAPVERAGLDERGEAAIAEHRDPQVPIAGNVLLVDRGGEREDLVVGQQLGARHGGDREQPARTQRLDDRARTSISSSSVLRTTQATSSSLDQLRPPFVASSLPAMM